MINSLKLALVNISSAVLYIEEAKTKYKANIYEDRLQFVRLTDMNDTLNDLMIRIEDNFNEG